MEDSKNPPPYAHEANAPVMQPPPSGAGAAYYQPYPPPPQGGYQQPYPQYNYYPPPPGAAAPAPAPAPAPAQTQQPKPATTTTTIVINTTGNCSRCRVGHVEENFTMAGICCAIWFFPCGMICCMRWKIRKCDRCGAMF